MQKLSQNQRRIRLKNPNVEKITDKQVIYTSKFKINAVERYLNRFKPVEIFLAADINPELFTKGYCKSCIKRWKKKYFEKGRDSLKVSGTGKSAGGRPKSLNTEEMTLDELKAIVEIQAEVIEMLKKNRAFARKKKTDYSVYC